jgi:hypothetical protein
MISFFTKILRLGSWLIDLFFKELNVLDIGWTHLKVVFLLQMLSVPMLIDLSDCKHFLIVILIHRKMVINI